MKIRVLGSAAGGGFPQWNCGCPNCRGVRSGALPARARTQESIAISADNEQLVFAECLAGDSRADRELSRACIRARPRDSPIAGVLLTNGDLDHCLGLLCAARVAAAADLRHRAGAARLHRRQFALCDARALCRARRAGAALSPGSRRSSQFLDGRASGLDVEAIAVPGQPPLHLRGRLHAVARGQCRLSHPRSRQRARDDLSVRRRRHYPGSARGRSRARSACSLTARSGRPMSSSRLGSGISAPRTWRICRSAAPTAALRCWRTSQRRSATTSTSITPIPSCARTRREYAAVDRGRLARRLRWPGVRAVSAAALPAAEFAAWLKREGAARYHDHHRYHHADARRQANATAAAAMGAEPLLLSDTHPHQRCAHSLQVR